MRRLLVSASLFSLLLATAHATAITPPALKLTGDWQVQVRVRPSAGGPDAKGITATLDVAPAAVVDVRGEKYDRVRLFNPRSGGWAKGTALRGVAAQECANCGLLVSDSLRLRAGPEANASLLELGKDYAADLDWGTFGRLPGGRIGEDQPVYADYRHGVLRLDSIVLTQDGRIVLRQGQPRAAAPLPPALEKGETRLANVWLPGRIQKLGPEHLFPILETAYPERPKPTPTQAEQLLPKTMEKLRKGQKLRVLAWGDSVTVATYLPDAEHMRWQAQFVQRLTQRFPQAKIELVTEAWGGRNTSSYLAEPPGSEHNYREKVLGARPDLIVSEFVNDAGMNLRQVEDRYSKLLADFRQIGAEWIILTPHYVRIDWMGLSKERDIDDDPRPYVHGLRQFAARHGVALADASLRYGRLWRQGIPFSTLMLNSINHPDARGMKLFVDSLMELFP